MKRFYMQKETYERKSILQGVEMLAVFLFAYTAEESLHPRGQQEG